MKTKNFLNESLNMKNVITPDNGSTMARHWLGNGSTKLHKNLGRIVALLCLLLTIGVGNAWGVDPTVTLDFDGSDASWPYDDDWSCDASSSTTNHTVGGTYSAGMSINGSQYITYKNELTNIKKVTLWVNRTTNNTANPTIVIQKSTWNGSAWSEWADVTGTSQTFSISKNTWTQKTFDFSSYKFTGKVRIKYTNSTIAVKLIDDIVITYEEASCDKKVTITKGTPESGGSFSLDKTGEQNCCSALTVTVSGITAPSGKQFSAITQVGIATGVTIDNAAKTVTYAANSTGSSTINVTFEDLPKYTVTYNAGSGTCATSTWTQGSAGASTTLPTATPSCDGWNFAGWCISSAGSSATTTSSPGTILTGSYTPTSNITLYAVYTKSGGGGGATLTKMVTGNTLSDGDKIVVVANGTDIAMYQETTNTSYVQTWDCSTLNTTTVSADDKNWWTVTAITGGFSLGDGTNGYLYSSSNNLYCGNTQQAWTLSDLGDGTFRLQSDSRNLSYRSDLATTKWRMGGTSYGTSGQTILDIYKYSTGGGTTYYMTNYACSSCAVPTALTNGSINQTNAEVSWTDAANASNGYYVAYSSSSNTTPGDITSSDATYTVQTISAGTKSATFSTLTCGTTYHWWVRANCGGNKSAWVAGTDITTSACTTPSVMATPNTVSGLDYIVGAGPSAAGNFSISGSNLENGTLTISAPTNFEVSLDNSSWGNSKTKSANGTLSATTVYVRLASSKAVNDYAGNVSISGCGLASAVTVAVRGSVLKPTITASPTSITGWTTETGKAPSPTTKSVSVTGANLKANISATLTSGGDYFTITPESLTQTSGSASGTITIGVKAAAYASAATRNGTLRLSTTDGDNVDVAISLTVSDDDREKFSLLTSSNVGQLSPGAKLVLVYDDYDMFEETHTFYAMNETQNGANGHEQTTTGFEMLSTNTVLAITKNNPQGVQVLELVETATDNIYALYTGSTKNTYLCNSASNKMNEAANFTDDNAKWSITVDGDGYAVIDAQGGNTQQIGFNTGASGAKFRCYSSGYSIYAYFKPSATPTISVNPNSLSDFTYVVGNGPSTPAKTFTVSGMNLSGTLTVALTAGSDKYEISKTSATTGFGSSVTFTGLDGTLGEQTIWVRLKAGITPRDPSISGTITVSGAGVAVGNNKTVSLSGSVTNPFHTVTISVGANGSVSPSGAQSVEEGQTLAVTATPNTGYSFSNWAVTGAGSSCTSSASGTFTMGTANATLTANFAQIMVSGITVSGDATVKTGYSKTYTVTVTPAGALTKTVTWSVINGTGTATINSSTGELTAGSPGTVTVRATANDGSGVYGELAVTIQDVVRYKFVKMTSTPSPWEDDDYLIVKESSSTAGYILKASDPFGTGEAGTGVGAERSVSISSGTITLEDDKDDAVHISYVDTKGYLVQGGGSNKFFILQSGTTTGGSSMKTLASDNTTNARYWLSITHNLLKYQNSATKYYNLAYNSNSFRFYEQNYTSSIVLYRLETAYSITCTTPSNGTLTSDMGSAASGTTVTLTVTPSSEYELNTLTITKDGGGTITPTKVDETHYTFTMPKDNVTVTAAFVTVRSKDIIFHTPECVSTPSTLSSKATGATVTLPDEPSGTPDGFTFQGWVLAEADGVSVKPTTYAPGSYTVPSGAADINMYALYSEGELSVSGSFSNITTLGSLTVPGYYVIGTANSGSQSVLSNTLSGKHIAPATVTPSSCSNAGAVWEITKPDSYWRIKNISTNTYVASTGTEKEATLMADGSADAAKWTVTATDAGYRFANKLLNDGSYSKKFLGYSASATDYRTMASGAGGDVLYLFKAGGGVVTDNTTYTTAPQCYCDYRLMASTNSGSTWTEVGCFVKVKPSDASDHEWRLADFEMPTHNSSNLLKVQKNGADLSGQTGAWQSGWIPLAEQQGTACTYKAFEMAGAVGTLRIYDNDGGNSVDANSNFYLGFYPTYQICHKNAGPDVWISEEFELVSSNTYQTAITTAPASYFADNYQYYVGVRKSDGTTKFAEKNSNEATAKSNTVNMKTMGGMTSDVGSRSGVYQIYSNSCDQNWYCTFIPYYVVYYHDVNGNEIEEWRDVLTSPTTTVHAYASGQTGWATSQGGAASATYNAGASITPAADVHLYQVASTYTVTYSVASETSSIDGTSVKVIQGQSVTLPMITFSCGLYDTHVGWVTGSDIPELEPAAKIDEPSTLVGAPGASFTPTANVTLKALYGYECDGNAGYQKQTTLTAGRYLIACPGQGKAYAGKSGGGDYSAIVDVTFADDGKTIIETKPGEAHEVVATASGTDFTLKDGDYYLSAPSTTGSGTNLLYYTASASMPSPITDAYLWNFVTLGDNAGTMKNKAYTRYIQYVTTSGGRFSTYTSAQTAAFFYKYIKRGYYTTNPTCDIPTELTVTFNANSPTGDAGDVSNMPTTIVRAFSSYPTLSSAINFSSNPTPTCDGYTIQKWNTAANGSGTDYALDATISTYSGNSLPLYAIWDRTYTVTFNNQGVTTPVTQASAGASVAVPSATAPCEDPADPDTYTWAFVGWSKTAIAPMSFLPTLEIEAGTGTYTPEEDVTLYAIYRKTCTSDAFVAGMSGAYKITNGSTVYAGACNSSKLPETDAAGAAVFYIKYTSAGGGKYTIQQADGKYLKYAGSSTSLALDNETPYYWTMEKNGTLWHVQSATSGRYLQHDAGTGFKAYTGSNTDLAFVPTEASYYYRTMSCASDFDITFQTGEWTISWADGHPEASYKHLADATVVSTFPTASYEDWTFLGWRASDYVESTAAPTSSEVYGGSDGTSGNAYTIASTNVTMHPVFTQFLDNEPFDDVNGGDYYIYFLESGSDDGYGGERRVYATSYSDKKRYHSTALCDEATEFTFTKLANGNWTIMDKTTGQYLYGIADDDLKQKASATGAEWTLTIHSGNEFDAFHVGTEYGQITAFGDGTSATFMNYRRTNIGVNPSYHRVYLGGCTERVFTTNPVRHSTITINGDVKVTSTASKAIKATSVLSVTANNINSPNLSVSSNNAHFTVSPTSISVSNHQVAATSIVVTYTPDAGATTDGTETATITVSDGAGTSETAMVTGRHLPADFVIAAKLGDRWYALPANCTTNESSTAGVLIEVDNASDPTCATSAPEYTKYGLLPVRPGRVASYGNRVVFTEHLSTATADNQKTLFNGDATSIQVYAQYSNYASSNPEKYEWIPATSDLKDYTLTSATILGGDAAARTVSLNTSGVFGTLLQAKAYDGKIRLLPATFYTPAAVQILKWKASSVIVMYAGTETSATTKVGTNAPSSAQTLSTHKLTHGIYELTTDQALTANAGQTLTITLGSTNMEVEIPLIIATNTTASANGKDVVILDGYKFTAAATKYTYRNIYVYGGGKLDIPTGTSLGVNNIILRAGGVSTTGIGSSPSATYQYVYPQVNLAGTLTSTQTNIKYEYVTDYYKWYHLVLPFNANRTSITYPQEYYGTIVAADNHGSWQIKRYDGATRATGDYDAWVDIESAGEPETISAGHGYIFWGAPKKLTIGGVTDRSAWGIQRITMPTTAADAMSAETANKSVTGLSPHNNVSNASSKPNDQGWNLIGNPYMVNLTGLTSSSLRQGQLEKEMVSGQWTGKWIFNTTNSNRYITVPDNHFTTYEAIAVAESGMTLTAGCAFFVQLATDADAVQFDVTKKASLAPMQWNAVAEQTVDIETGIVMTDETLKDEVDFWIKDGKTEAYEFNADYPKTPNQTNFNIYGVHETGKLSWIAISPEIAEGSMAIGYQVPAAGDYTLSLSEKFPEEKIEALFVTDHAMSPEVTTNLTEENYTFTVHQAESNDERFTVSVKLKKQTDVVTDIGAGGTTQTQAVKFIHNDKLYILRNGLIYDATGKRVSVINK